MGRRADVTRPVPLLAGLLAAVSLAALAGRASAPEPLPMITRNSSQEEVLSHFHLGTVADDKFAYSRAGALPGVQFYVYEGGEEPNRWGVQLLLEDRRPPRPVSPPQAP